MTTEERLENLERDLARAKRRNRWQVAVVGLVVVVLIMAWMWKETTVTAQAQAVGGTVPPPPRYRRRSRWPAASEKHEAAQDAIDLARWKRIHDETMNAALRSAEDAPDENSVMAIFQRASLQVSPATLIKSSTPSVEQAYARFYEGQRASWENKFAKLAKAVGRAEKVIRAKRFVLEDENGKTRASLIVGKDGPGLVLLDENGKPRAMLSVLKDGPGLALYDENGNVIKSLP